MMNGFSYPPPDSFYDRERNNQKWKIVLSTMGFTVSKFALISRWNDRNLVP